LGLTWRDVDHDQRVLAVRQTLQYHPGEGFHLVPPKTARSRRIFGTPLSPRNDYREFRRLVAAAGLRRVRLHDLRHTAASLMLAQGVNPRVVMEILGHSQIGVTMNTYSHVTPASSREAVARVEACCSRFTLELE